MENLYYENNITNSIFGQLRLTAFFDICYNDKNFNISRSLNPVS